MGTIIGNLLRSIFGGLTAKVKKLLPEVIQIITNVKNFVDSPEADFITSVIPGTLDDKLQDLLKNLLPKVLDALNKVPSIAAIPEQNERSKAIVKDIQTSNPIAREGLIRAIATNLVQGTTGASSGKSVIIAEGVYQEPNLLKA